MKVLILSPNSPIRHIILIIVALLVASTGCSSSTTTNRRQLLRNENYNVNKYHQNAARPVIEATTNFLEEHISGLQIDDNTAILERELMTMGSMSMIMSMSMHLDGIEKIDEDEDEDEKIDDNTNISMDIIDEIPTESPIVVVVASPTTAPTSIDDDEYNSTDILKGRYEDEPTISDIVGNTDLVAPTTDDGFSDRLDQIIAMAQGKDYEAEKVPESGPSPYLFFLFVLVVFFIAICLYCV